MIIWFTDKIGYDIKNAEGKVVYMNGKQRLLLTAKLLQEKTDETHSLTRREIGDILSHEYGIEAADRNTFSADIEALFI